MAEDNGLMFFAPADLQTTAGTTKKQLTFKMSSAQSPECASCPLQRRS